MICFPIVKDAGTKRRKSHSDNKAMMTVSHLLADKMIDTRRQSRATEGTVNGPGSQVYPYMERSLNIHISRLTYWHIGPDDGIAQNRTWRDNRCQSLQLCSDRGK